MKKKSIVIFIFLVSIIASCHFCQIATAEKWKYPAQVVFGLGEKINVITELFVPEIIYYFKWKKIDMATAQRMQHGGFFIAEFADLDREIKEIAKQIKQKEKIYMPKKVEVEFWAKNSNLKPTVVIRSVYSLPPSVAEFITFHADQYHLVKKIYFKNFKKARISYVSSIPGMSGKINIMMSCSFKDDATSPKLGLPIFSGKDLAAILAFLFDRGINNAYISYIIEYNYKFKKRFVLFLHPFDKSIKSLSLMQGLLYSREYEVGKFVTENLLSNFDLSSVDRCIIKGYPGNTEINCRGFKVNADGRVEDNVFKNVVMRKYLSKQQGEYAIEMKDSALFYSFLAYCAEAYLKSNGFSISSMDELYKSKVSKQIAALKLLLLPRAINLAANKGQYRKLRYLAKSYISFVKEMHKKDNMDILKEFKAW